MKFKHTEVASSDLQGKSMDVTVAQKTLALLLDMKADASEELKPDDEAIWYACGRLTLARARFAMAYAYTHATTRDEVREDPRRSKLQVRGRGLVNGHWHWK